MQLAKWNNKHLMLAPTETLSFVSPRPPNIEGRGETILAVSRGASHQVFCYTFQLKIQQDMDVSEELRSVLLSSWKLLSKICSLQKSLDVISVLSVTLLVDFERLSCRSCSVSSSVLI